jgi:hypothetical protein
MIDFQGWSGPEPIFIFREIQPAGQELHAEVFLVNQA